MAAIDTVVADALDRAADGFVTLGQVSERLTVEADPASYDHTIMTLLPISRGNSGLRKIIRNLTLDFATFAWTGQPMSRYIRLSRFSLSCASPT